MPTMQLLTLGDDLKNSTCQYAVCQYLKKENTEPTFIGYASTFSTTRKMLENMFIGSPVGNTDPPVGISVHTGK